MGNKLVLSQINEIFNEQKNTLDKITEAINIGEIRPKEASSVKKQLVELMSYQNKGRHFLTTKLKPAKKEKFKKTLETQDKRVEERLQKIL